MTIFYVNDSMEVSFKREKDRQLFEDFSLLSIKYGPRSAKKIIQRLAELSAAKKAGDLPKNARFHEHKGDRKNLFSLDLIHPFRLIVFPTCEFSIWTEIDSVQFYEIIDPH